MSVEVKKQVVETTKGKGNVANFHQARSPGEVDGRINHNRHTRAKNNRAIQQQALRERLSAGGHVQGVVKCLTLLTDIEADARKVKKFDRNLQAKYAVRIAAIQKRMDGHLRLINKYLPDLRTTTIEEGGTGNDAMRSALTAWAEALNNDPD